MLTLAPSTTALVLIDLQNGILDLPLAPRSGADVLATARHLASRFRSVGAPVVIVNVAFSSHGEDMLKAPVDRPMQIPEGGFPAGWSDLAPGLVKPGDIRITKRHWGAFYGTELDLQLRRRGITTIVLAGIATNIGVESTARSAHEHGYAIVVAEDACTSRSAEMHGFAVASIFPLLSRVTRAEAIALG